MPDAYTFNHMKEEVTPTLLEALSSGNVENQFTKKLRKVKMEFSQDIAVRMSNSSTLLKSSEYDDLETYDILSIMDKVCCRRSDSKKVKTILFDFSKYSNQELSKFCTMIPKALP